MAYFDWDDQDHRADRSLCIGCGANMEYSEELICSATCADILALRGSNREDSYV